MLAALLTSGAAELQGFEAHFDASFPQMLDPVDPFRAHEGGIRAGAKPTSLPITGSDIVSLVERRKEEITVTAEPATRTGLLAAVGQIWSKLLADRLGWAIVVLVGCGLAAGALVVSRCGGDNPFEPPPGAERESLPVLGWAFAAMVAAGLLGPALLVLRWVTREEPVIARQKSRKPGSVDAVVFRVGLIGGAPPRRVDPDRMRTIADLFGYSPGEEDARELDVERTIGSVIASGGMPIVRHPAERLLPVILVLIDGASPGRHWNSTPDEVSTALVQRGLDVRVRSFTGSLHRPGSTDRVGALQATALGREILALSDEEPYVVTMVFSDGARWRDADTRLLAEAGLGGPVLWFDDRDRELWDARLDSQRRARIPIFEASDAGIEEALRAAYAPGRGIGTRAKAAGAALSRRKASTLEGEMLALLGSALGWARHCALLQPISVALAERIRQRFHPALPWMAFARLCTLPGSTIGPEGLRFGAAIGSFLITGFALREPGRLRDAVVAFITGEIGRAGAELPVDSAAEALCSLVSHRVAVHSRPDEAVREIVRLRDEGLVEAEPLTRFLDRLQPVAGVKGKAGLATTDAPILIAAPMRRAETLEALNRVAAKPSREVLPRWEISSPEVRIDMSRAPEQARSLWAFAREDQLIGSRVGDEIDSLTTIVLPSGVQAREALPVGRLDMLHGSDGVVAAATRDGRVFGLFFESSEPGRFDRQDGEPRSREQESELGQDFLFVSPRKRVAVAVSRSMFSVIGPEGQRPSLSTESYELLTAACDFDDEVFLAGSRSGRLVAVPWDGKSLSVSELRLPGRIVALAAPPASGSSSSPLRGGTAAVAYAVGTEGAGQRCYLALLDVERKPSAVIAKVRRTLPVGAAPVGLELSQDAATLLVILPNGIDVIDTLSGLSLLTSDADLLLASLGGRGSGEPREARVVAASLASRRVALLTGDPSRLEVRRLERLEAEEIEDPDPDPPTQPFPPPPDSPPQVSNTARASA